MIVDQSPQQTPAARKTPSLIDRRAAAFREWLEERGKDPKTLTLRDKRELATRFRQELADRAGCDLLG